MGTRAAGKLLELVVDPSNGEDFATAGMLALAVDDREGAEQFFDLAESAGADVSTQLAALAVATMTRSDELLTANEFQKTVSLLDEFQANYSDLLWLASHRETFDAALATARDALHEDEAESLYNEAVQLLKQTALFDLRDIVTRLNTDFATTQVGTDETRQPSLADLSRAVAELGQKVIVRQDGKGGHVGIQAAIDAVPDNSLIEIHDIGPYREQIRITKTGLTLRGKKGVLPVIMCVSGAEQSQLSIIETDARGTRLERLVLIRPNTSANMHCVAARTGDLSLRAVLMSMPGNPAGLLVAQPSRCEAQQCLFLAVVTGEGKVKLSGSLCLARDTTENARASVHVRYEGVEVRDCTTLGEV